MRTRKACRFCGNDFATVEHDVAADEYRVVCQVCRASGPPASTYGGAVSSWDEESPAVFRGTVEVD